MQDRYVAHEGKAQNGFPLCAIDCFKLGFHSPPYYNKYLASQYTMIITSSFVICLLGQNMRCDQKQVASQLAPLVGRCQIVLDCQIPVLYGEIKTHTLIFSPIPKTLRSIGCRGKFQLRACNAHYVFKKIHRASRPSNLCNQTHLQSAAQQLFATNKQSATTTTHYFQCLTIYKTLIITTVPLCVSCITILTFDGCVSTILMKRLWCFFISSYT